MVIGTYDNFQYFSCPMSQLVVIDELSLLLFPWKTLDIWVHYDVAVIIFQDLYLFGGHLKY